MTRTAGPAAEAISGIWAALPTPFLADGAALDHAGIAANARHCRALGLAGVFCHGLMGEGAALALDERRAALEALAEGAGDALRIGVVVTHHAPAETIALARHAAAAARAHHLVLMRPPGLLGAEELIDHVRAVTDAAAGLPAVLFDSAAAGWPEPAIATLAREGRLIGVKCTRDADACVALRAALGGAVAVCDPYEGHFLANLLRFDHRALYADPEPYLFQTPARRPIAATLAAHAAGDAGAAARHWAGLEPLRRVYEAWILAPLRAGRSPAPALKHWCARMGMAAGPVRAPLRDLDASARGALDAALDAAFAACGMVGA